MPSGSVHWIPGMIAIICRSELRWGVCERCVSPAEIIISSDWIADSEVVRCISTVCLARPVPDANRFQFGCDAMDRLKTLFIFAGLLTTSSVHADTVRYTIAGDVPKPDTIEVDQNLGLRELLLHSGSNAPGKAVIIRGSSHLAFVENVFADSAGPGSILVDGDVVVFHRDQTTATMARHVILLGGDVPTFARLEAGEYQLGALLNVLGRAVPAGNCVDVLRTEMGGTRRLHLPLHETVVHGDVLLLPMTATGTSRSRQRVQNYPLTLLSDSAPLQIRSASTIDSSLPSAPVASAGSDTHSAMVPLQSPDDTSNDSADDDFSDVPLTTVALETPLGATDGGTPVLELPSSGPADSEPMTVASPPAVVPPLWNGLFIFGILGAVLLIVTGWLKVRQEQEAQISPPRMTTWPLQTTHSVSESAAPFTSSWTATPASPSVEIPLPVGATTVTTMAAEQIPVSAEIAAPGLVRGAPAKKSAPKSQIVKDDEWYGASWREASAAAVAVPGNMAKGEIEAEPTAEDDVIPIAMPSEQPEASSSPMSTADDLEDLIQNRLPVDLQQAQLPLRVSLFGRPAGPRRLRIDSAHKQLAAPHFAADSHQQHIAESVGAATDGGSDMKASGSSDFASLDRALDSLHGQGH